MKKLLSILLLFTSFNIHAGTINDVQADMGLNEAPLMNPPATASWAKKGTILMGSAPRGDATPSWWNPTNTAYKSSTPWNAISPWFVIYPGANNVATNTRIKLSQIRMYALDKTTKRWVNLTTSSTNPTWAVNYNFNAAVKNLGTATPRLEPDGTLSYKLLDYTKQIHGGATWGNFLSAGVSPGNIGAILVTMKSQLILDDPKGVDDRAKAQILVNIGADYYPTMNSRIADFTPTGYVPGAGGSRFGLVSAVQRTHYFSTIDAPGPTDRSSNFVKNGGIVAMPVTQFWATSPPVVTATE